MKKLFLIVFSALLLAACATTKTTTAPVVTPEGSWDYSITGTPEGDFEGVMDVTSVNNVWVAKMASSGNELTIENFAYDKESQKITGDVPYGGMSILLDVVMTGDILQGNMSAGGMTFPFKATRKK